jgi:hypothetical protein
MQQRGKIKDSERCSKESEPPKGCTSTPKKSKKGPVKRRKASPQSTSPPVEEEPSLAAKYLASLAPFSAVYGHSTDGRGDEADALSILEPVDVLPALSLSPCGTETNTNTLAKPRRKLSPIRPPQSAEMVPQDSMKACVEPTPSPVVELSEELRRVPQSQKQNSKPPRRVSAPSVVGAREEAMTNFIPYEDSGSCRLQRLSVVSEDTPEKTDMPPCVTNKCAAPHVVEEAPQAVWPYRPSSRPSTSSCVGETMKLAVPPQEDWIDRKFGTKLEAVLGTAGKLFPLHRPSILLGTYNSHKPSEAFSQNAPLKKPNTRVPDGLSVSCHTPRTAPLSSIAPIKLSANTTSKQASSESKSCPPQRGLAIKKGQKNDPDGLSVSCHSTRTSKTATSHSRASSASRDTETSVPITVVAPTEALPKKKAKQVANDGLSVSCHTPRTSSTLRRNSMIAKPSVAMKKSSSEPEIKNTTLKKSTTTTPKLISKTRSCPPPRGLLIKKGGKGSKADELSVSCHSSRTVPSKTVKTAPLEVAGLASDPKKMARPASDGLSVSCHTPRATPLTGSEFKQLYQQSGVPKKTPSDSDRKKVSVDTSTVKPEPQPQATPSFVPHQRMAIMKPKKKKVRDELSVSCHSTPWTSAGIVAQEPRTSVSEEFTMPKESLVTRKIKKDPYGGVSASSNYMIRGLSLAPEPSPTVAKSTPTTEGVRNETSSSFVPHRRLSIKKKDVKSDPEGHSMLGRVPLKVPVLATMEESPKEPSFVPHKRMSIKKKTAKANSETATLKKSTAQRA